MITIVRLKMRNIKLVENDNDSKTEDEEYKVGRE